MARWQGGGAVAGWWRGRPKTGGSLVAERHCGMGQDDDMKVKGIGTQLGLSEGN